VSLKVTSNELHTVSVIHMPIYKANEYNINCDSFQVSRSF